MASGGMISLGCEKNRVDAEMMMARLQKAGYELVDDASCADVASVNTCGFIEAAKKAVSYTHLAPKIFGGAAAKTPVAGIGVELPSQAVRLKNTVVVQLGKDFLLESEVDGNVYGDC